MVLHYPPGNMAFRQVGGDALPRLTAVGGFQDIGCEIAALVVVHYHVDRVGVVQVGADVINEEVFRNTGQFIQLPPVGATILADLDQAVIGARIEQTFHQGRFRQGGNRGITGHGIHVPG